MSSDTATGARSTLWSLCIARIKLGIKASLLLLLTLLALNHETQGSTAHATSLYPELSIRGGVRIPSQLSLTRLWFPSPVSACSMGFDTLSLLWLQARLIALCPYVHARTSLAVELSPELQWPSGETRNEPVRPGIRIAHLQNTRLNSSVTHFFRISYKVADDRRFNGERTDRPPPLLSIALLQEWADLADAVYETGLLLRLTKSPRTATSPAKNAQPEEAVLFSYLQTLPLSLRESGILRETALAKWAQLSLAYRRSSGSLQWGMGLSYGSLSFDRLHLSGIFPTLHLAVLFDSPATFEGRPQ